MSVPTDSVVVMVSRAGEPACDHSMSQSGKAICDCFIQGLIAVLSDEYGSDEAEAIVLQEAALLVMADLGSDEGREAYGILAKRFQQETGITTDVAYHWSRWCREQRAALCSRIRASLGGRS